MPETPKRQHIAKYSGLKLKDYIFYALGDVGCCLVFTLNTALLQNYYTDAMFLNPWFIMIMFVAVRIWDAINDPIMGRIVDRMKPSKTRGKFKRWFIYGGFPLMIATILMFIEMPTVIGSDGWNKFIWAYVFVTITYTLFGMMYTAVQIPYGSLASAVTADEKERSKLSIFRAVGGAIGGTPIIIINMFVFYNDSTGRQVVDRPVLWASVIGLAVCSFIAMFIAYKGNKERVPIKPVPREKGAFVKGFKRLFKNHSMVALCITGMLLLSQGMFTGSFFGYVLRNYYHVNGVWAMIPSLVGQFAPVVFMFAAPALAKKMGKKELSAAGLVLCVLCYAAMFCLVFVPANGTVIIDGTEYANHSNTLNYFYILKSLSEVGICFINLQIWGMIADCIDDVQVKSGIREDGTSYAVFMFFRKFGQVIAAISINGSLIAMGYNFAGAANFSEDQIRLMYYLGTLIPVAMIGIAAFLMIFRYPLNKKRLEELQDKKEAFYAAQEAEEKRLNKLPKVYDVKMTQYKPNMKHYRGFQFEFLHKERKYFYCVLIKENSNLMDKAYRYQAQFKFKALVRSKSFDEYIENSVGLSVK